MKIDSHADKCESIKRNAYYIQQEAQQENSSIVK